MVTFEVKDMTCGHCVSTISKALKFIDRKAKVTIDLGKRFVIIEPTESDPIELRDAIIEAGYTPVLVEVEIAKRLPTPY